MKDLVLARRPNDLNVNWAQSIIDQHKAHVAVANVDIVSVDIGTTTRVRLYVEHDGPDYISRCWFVKLPSLDWRARLITALPRLLHTEVRFYQELSQQIPVERPELLAACSRLGKGNTLVLRDITEQGARPGRSGEALSLEQAYGVIKQLGHLHSLFWNKATGNPSYRWLHGPVRRLEDHLGTALAVPLMKRGLVKAGDVIPSVLQGPALRYARQRRKAMKYLASGPQTLIHHDCHPGNLFWKNAAPGFLDWQLVRLGEGISDVAYFLATALDPEIRRQHELSLLTSYFQVLHEHGISDLDFQKNLQRYRAHLVYPFEAMVVTLAIGGLMAHDSNLEMIRRAAIAAQDLDAFAALPI